MTEEPILSLTNQNDPAEMNDADADALGMKFLKAAETGEVQKMGDILTVNPNLLNFQDEDGYSALHRAAYSDQPKSVEFLLSRNLSPTIRTKDGWTPLHSAARWNAFSALKVLLRTGADVNVRSNGGQTPLHLAGDSGKGECVTLLLLHSSIDVKILNNAGDTAVDLAARAGGYAYLFDLAEESLNQFKI